MTIFYNLYSVFGILYPFSAILYSIFCMFYILTIYYIQGLGEEYADDYIKAKTGNAVEDKDESTRSECRILLKSLFAKLDALSHFHFAPKPIIKEMSVQKEVPALAMEEIAPQVTKKGSLLYHQVQPSLSYNSICNICSCKEFRRLSLSLTKNLAFYHSRRRRSEWMTLPKSTHGFHCLISQ